MNRRPRQSLVAVAVGGLLASTALVALNLAGGAAPAATQQGEAELPSALGRHLATLAQTVPGNGGESPEGPGGGADNAFVNKAYPASTISVAKQSAAREAFAKANSRPLTKAAAASWQLIGPSRALYPFEPLRNSTNYVPNAYVAGGRTTDVAISDTCKPGDCRMYITPAGGGVWRTNNALASPPVWKYLGGPLGINAAGSVTIDPNDPTGNTVYAGTGEANICGSGCVAGVGMYKSTNGGTTCTGPLGGAPTDSGNPLAGKGIGDIVIKPGDPKTIYAGTTSALRGMSSSCCVGVTRPVPDAEKWGLYKSTNGGSTWTFIHNGSSDPATCTGSSAEFANTATCSPRGVRNVVLDPTNPNTLYASSYARGVWRSTDAGATWTQIKASLNSAVIQTRPSIAVTKWHGTTRMYVYEGNIGTPYARLFRSDDVHAAAPTFTDLTSANPADPGYATFDQCGGQCWYDQFVYTPKGHPNIVYSGGSYAYGETGGLSNGRAVILSTNAGVSGTDMTFDGTDAVHPNGLHPDQHALVTHPNNPYQFFEANDGGLMRSSGQFVNRSSWCDGRGIADPAQLARCKQLLSKIPSKLTGMNDGLSTLQFISLSVSPFNANFLQGGTQDNGTWENRGSTTLWKNTMIGDGGASGFDAKKPAFRFHTFFEASPEVNFKAGKTSDWIWTADPIFGHAGTQFYAPVISDPLVSGTMFAGTGSSVYRTKTHGLGTRTMAEAQAICNSWTGTFAEVCGDWEQLGAVPLSGPTNVNDGEAIAQVERSTTDLSTAWVATTTGRVFVSHNVNAEPASAVTWTRLDDTATNDPNRFVSGIYVDPSNPHRAYLSYSGYNLTTPGTPGHVFLVHEDGAAATWTDLSGDLADLPINDVVLDRNTGDLFASSDFGVLRRTAGTTTWTLAAPGMPNVEVAGLTIVPGKRILYAATHGRSAYRLKLS